MIKYSSIDIIKRAEQLADLENSDFISDYEKLALLNENWSILYQKIINSGDKTFIKKINVSNGMKLPADFYQLSDIYTVRDHNPIMKKSATQKYGYDLVEGRFVLSKDYNNVEVIAEYYPAPKTLYLKNKTKDSDYSTDTVACNGSLYYTKDKKIYDLYDADVGTEAQFTSDNVAMFDNAAINYDYVTKISVNHEDFKPSSGLAAAPDGWGIASVKVNSVDKVNIYIPAANPSSNTIVTDDIKVSIPAVANHFLPVNDYPTIADIKAAGLQFTNDCNNSALQIGYSQMSTSHLIGGAATGILSDIPVTYDSLTFAANTSTDIMDWTTGDYHIYSISYDYDGQHYDLSRDADATYTDGFFNTEKGCFIVEGNYKSEITSTLRAFNDNSTDMTITNVVIKKFWHYSQAVWVPSIYNPTTSTISEIFNVSTDYITPAYSTGNFTEVTDEPTETKTGWSSKEIAMQAFLYDSNSMATAFQENNIYVPFIIDNELYIMNKNTYEIIDFYGNKYDTLSVTFDEAPSWIYANRNYDTMYAVYEDQIIYYNRLEKTATYDCDDFRGKAVLNGKTLYAVTTGNKLIKCKDKVDIIETKYVPVTIIDENNVLTHKPLTSRYFVEGTVENTVLDFGNNISYIMLSYLLAIAFKSKQGADTTLLANQLAVAEQQFYDSINKDINEQYTVKNVYKHRRFF